MANVRKFMHEICLICKSSKKQRTKFIKGAENNVIKALCDVIATLLHGDYTQSKLGKIISEKTRAKLRRHKKILLSLADKKKSIKSKRRILNQRGGGVLSTIGGFIDKLFGI
jgi:hypothetical protein